MLERALVSGYSLNSAYNERIDHLRFFAALLIVFHHAVCPFLCVLHNVDNTWMACYQIMGNCSGLTYLAQTLTFEGHTAVALFMTLSGFLFARICKSKQIEYKGFLLNRILRIYPLFMSAILLAVYVSPDCRDLLKVLSSVLCLQNVSGVDHRTITSQLWTIAVEFQFYLLFPFFLKFQRERGNIALWKFIALAVVIRALVYFTAGTVNDFAYRTIFGRIDQFLIGMMLGLSFDSISRAVKHPIFLFTSLTTLLAGLLTFHKFGGWEYTSRSPLWIVFSPIEASLWGFVIVSYCACSIKMNPTISRFFAFLGTLSFSVYVTHYFFARTMIYWFQPYIEKYFHPALASGGTQFWLACGFTALAVVPVTCLVSWLTYSTIEKPFLDMRVKYVK